MHFKKIILGAICAASVSFAQDNNEIDLKGHTPLNVDREVVKKSYYKDQSGFRIVFKNNTFVKATEDSVRDLIDPSKPLMVHLHGWRGNNRSTGQEPLFDDEILPENAMNMWRRAGWNVVFYNWIQYADDMNFLRAECRIWSNQCDGKNITWLDTDGKLHPLEEKISLSEKVANEFASLFKDVLDPNQELRIVGHSLGTQLALATSERLLQDHNIKATRIALTDLTSTLGKKNYLNNRWIGQKLRTIAKKFIDQGTAIENYRCWKISQFPPFDKNSKFDEMVFTVNKKLDFIPNSFLNFNPNTQHRSCYYLYLWSISDKPDDEFTASKLENFAGAGAPTSLIIENQRSTLDQVQNSTSENKTPVDDEYKVSTSN